MFDLYSLTMILSIASFTLATVLTPGPNNIMLLSSGLNFGYKRTLPHILGVAIGFPFMVVLVGLGIGELFTQYPIVYNVFKIIGLSYLLWMAWQIASSSFSYDEEKLENKKPFTFIQIVLFQWMNPKAWIMALTAASSFINNDKDIFLQVLVIAFIYLLSGIVSTNVWTLLGTYLQKFLKNKNYLRMFNILMAILIVASIIPVIFD